jgi:glucosamine-6-phosphate deaminase
MEVVVRDKAEDAAAMTAAIVANAIRVKPCLVLGLATGRTMESVYRLLITMHKDGRVDFSRVITFNLGEYIGVPQSDSRSFLADMNQGSRRQPDFPRLPSHS